MKHSNKGTDDHTATLRGKEEGVKTRQRKLPTDKDRKKKKGKVSR
jgi:hypothetical protein